MPDINPVTVEKAALLKILRENRDRHGSIYEKAWAGYRKAAIAELESMLDRIREGQHIAVALANIPPEDHTSDYEDVIDMLEMDTGDRVVLSQAQFRCYVKDNWGWKQTWTTSNTAYIESSQ
jgi:hypothetical protein